jgi:hypothetical protein
MLLYFTRRTQQVLDVGVLLGFLFKCLGHAVEVLFRDVFEVVALRCFELN